MERHLSLTTYGTRNIGGTIETTFLGFNSCGPTRPHLFLSYTTEKIVLRCLKSQPWWLRWENEVENRFVRVVCFLTRCGGRGAGGARGAALPLVFPDVAHVEGLDEAAVFRLVTAADKVGDGTRRDHLAVVAEEVCVVCEYRNREQCVDRANCREEVRVHRLSRPY